MDATTLPPNVLPTAKGTGAGETSQAAQDAARDLATPKPYSGDPMHPSPQLLRMIAHGVKGAQIDEASEGGKKLVEWSEAFLNTYPNP